MKLPLELVISVLTAATMLAVGLELNIKKVPAVVRRKIPIAGLLLGQMLLLPALAILIIRSVPMPASTQFVVLMLAACPTGNIANFFTLLARGDLALTVTASAISCLLAPVVMPVTFALYRELLGASFPFMVPTDTLLTRIFVLTWAPIFLGLGLRQVPSSRMQRMSVILRQVCTVGTVGLCGFICVSRGGELTSDWKTNVLVSLMLIVAALVGAGLISLGLRISSVGAVSYFTSFPARHIGVLAAVSVTTLHRLGDLAFILVYL